MDLIGGGGIALVGRLSGIRTQNGQNMSSPVVWSHQLQAASWLEKSSSLHLLLSGEQWNSVRSRPVLVLTQLSYSKSVGVFSQHKAAEE